MDIQKEICIFSDLFKYAHLSEKLQKVSKPFGDLAGEIIRRDQYKYQTLQALQKLLEAKDCAVRAAL